MPDLPKVQSLDHALRWLDRLQAAALVKSETEWPVAAVLEHLAQSTEMSMDGFPVHKSALFQHTAGAAAFAVFKLRGRMSHGLTAAIPGAPALRMDAALAASAERLCAAIVRFQRHQGPLQPHFAYGRLSHADFALAHAMHIANHQDAMTVS